MERVEWRCPHCSKKLSASVQRSGTEVNCPACSLRVVVPTERANRGGPSHETGNRRSVREAKCDEPVESQADEEETESLLPSSVEASHRAATALRKLWLPLGLGVVGLACVAAIAAVFGGLRDRTEPRDEKEAPLKEFRDERKALLPQPKEEAKALLALQEQLEAYGRDCGKELGLRKKDLCWIYENQKRRLSPSERAIVAERHDSLFRHSDDWARLGEYDRASQILEEIGNPLPLSPAERHQLLALSRGINAQTDQLVQSFHLLGIQVRLEPESVRGQLLDVGDARDKLAIRLEKLRRQGVLP